MRVEQRLNEIYQRADQIPYDTYFYHPGWDQKVCRISLDHDDGPACDDADSVGMGANPFDSDWEYIELAELYTVIRDDDFYDEPEPSIARPVLEERKVGKVQVHLLDQGFPNALMEIAKVMTWAAENKGYKPHDWKNLPDAENAFEGAASRHRMEHNMQRQDGSELLACRDHESCLLHKAHEAFNVLAELELIITGKIA